MKWGELNKSATFFIAKYINKKKRKREIIRYSYNFFLSSAPRLSFSLSGSLSLPCIWWIFIFFHFRSTLIPPRLGSVCEARGEKARLHLLLSLFTLFSCRVVIYSFIYLFICFLGSIFFFFWRFWSGVNERLCPFFWHGFKICAQRRRSELRRAWRHIRRKADMRDMCQWKRGDICYFVLSRAEFFCFRFFFFLRMHTANLSTQHFSAVTECNVFLLVLGL